MVARYISMKREMIYIDNIAEAQRCLIPRDIDTDGALRLTLRSTFDNDTALEVDAIDLGSSERYYDLSFALPEGLADGEYEYALTGEGKELSTGIVQLGDYGCPSKQTENTIEYEQY